MGVRLGVNSMVKQNTQTEAGIIGIATSDLPDVARRIGDFDTLEDIFHECRSTYLRQYPDQEIGIYGGGEVVVGDDMDELYVRLDEMNVPLNAVSIHFLDAKKPLQAL